MQAKDQGTSIRGQSLKFPWVQMQAQDQENSVRGQS